MTERTTISFVAPEAMKERLERYAQHRDGSVSALIRVIIRDWERRMTPTEERHLVMQPTGHLHNLSARVDPIDALVEECES